MSEIMPLHIPSDTPPKLKAAIKERNATATVANEQLAEALKLRSQLDAAFKVDPCTDRSPAYRTLAAAYNALLAVAQADEVIDEALQIVHDQAERDYETRGLAIHAAIRERLGIPDWVEHVPRECLLTDRDWWTWHAEGRKYGSLTRGCIPALRERLDRLPEEIAQLERRAGDEEQRAADAVKVRDKPAKSEPQTSWTNPRLSHHADVRGEAARLLPVPK